MFKEKSKKQIGLKQMRIAGAKKYTGESLSQHSREREEIRNKAARIAVEKLKTQIIPVWDHNRI